MTPFDLIYWAAALLIASLPVGMSIMIVGYSLILIRKEWKK